MGANVVEIVEEGGLGSSRIGVIGLGFYPPFYFDGSMPYNTWQPILEGLPDATFEPVGRRLFELIAPRSAEHAPRWVSVSESYASICNVGSAALTAVSLAPSSRRTIFAPCASAAAL